jgi:transposase-like protein
MVDTLLYRKAPPYIMDSDISVKCKFCQSNRTVKYGVRNNVQYYLCRDDGRIFSGSDAPTGMRTPAKEIATALTMFYQGSTFSSIQEQIDKTYQHKVAPSTIHRWVVKYTNKASSLLAGSKANTSDVWVIYETIMEINGNNCWFWDILCEDTKFLLASHMSYARTLKEGKITINRALKNTAQAPTSIILDGLLSYPKQVEEAFELEMIHACVTNINISYSFLSTIRQRTTVMSRLKSMNSASLILDGFVLNYNFFTTNASLNNRTPAESARLKPRFKDWEGLIRYQP